MKANRTAIDGYTKFITCPLLNLVNANTTYPRPTRNVTMIEAHNGNSNTAVPTIAVISATQRSVCESGTGSRYVPVSIVFAALAWNITPGRSLDLLTGAVFTSPSVVAVAPMKTILPATLFFGNVLLITSTAEITFAVPERSGEKLSSIDLASSVGTNRSPICNPCGRTMN